MKQDTTSKLEIIQLLRAVAAICVVVSHIAHELSVKLAGKVEQFNAKLFPGDFGVDLFFVISGFIMVYTCWNKFGDRKWMIDFWAKRLIRIVPLYWIMTCLMIFVVVLLPQNVNTATSDWGQWISSFLFIPYARESDGLIRPVLGLGWSLQYEILFYFLFGIALIFSRAKGIIFVASTIVLLCLAANFALAGGGFSSTYLHFIGHPIILEFTAGVALGYFFMRGFRLSNHAGWIAGIAGFVLLITVPSFNETIDQQRSIHYGIPAVLMVLAAVFPVGYEDLRVNKFAVQLGEVSYAIYLTHPFVIGAVALIFSRMDLFESLGLVKLMLTFSATVIVISLFAGFVAHYIFDLPITNYLRSKWTKLRAKTKKFAPPES